MDQLSILIWNLRGLNSFARQSVVCSLVRDNHISIVCFQETKVQLVTLQLIVQACGPRFQNFISVPSNGASGGLIIAWDDDLVQIDEVSSSNNFILALLLLGLVVPLGCCAMFMDRRALRRRLISSIAYPQPWPTFRALLQFWEIST